MSTQTHSTRDTKAGDEDQAHAGKTEPETEQSGDGGGAIGRRKVRRPDRGGAVGGGAPAGAEMARSQARGSLGARRSGERREGGREVARSSLVWLGLLGRFDPAGLVRFGSV